MNRLLEHRGLQVAAGPGEALGTGVKDVVDGAGNAFDGLPGKVDKPAH